MIVRKAKRLVKIFKRWGPKSIKHPPCLVQTGNNNQFPKHTYTHRSHVAVGSRSMECWLISFLLLLFFLVMELSMANYCARDNWVVFMGPMNYINFNRKGLFCRLCGSARITYMEQA